MINYWTAFIITFIVSFFVGTIGILMGIKYEKDYTAMGIGRDGEYIVNPVYKIVGKLEFMKIKGKKESK